MAKREKEGLHGWRAFFVVFLSGTIAALLVFGAAVGIFRFFFSSLVSGGGQQAGAEPRESLPPGQLDLCEQAESSLEGDHLIERVDTGEPDDSAESDPSADVRTVEDECQWKIEDRSESESERVEWDLTLSYTAIADSSGKPKEDIADERFKEVQNGLESDFSEVGLQTETGEVGDEAYYLNGSSGEDPQEILYSLAVKTNSSFYKISMSGGNLGGDINSIDPEPFDSVVYSMDKDLDWRLNNWIN
ncbi:hypothetical protein F4561_000630 [Lipingzhangella halophila]|uniref:Uncharacterized protein n=1 Tax=Lipingzhangella halophila TaxID=1783352 RepID=A0A7W7RDH7_9ACTN|nr:hypothetical protein [Lipingzhangella halophila]MBB4929810.1 hypothetical protein [Lipingzhangella halophila]